jgi:PadR family transcriptional regulator
VADVEVGRTQLLKGVLDLVVLAVLAEEDGYGYKVVRALRDAGLSEVGEASVYGTLRRLFRAGLLTSYVVASAEGPHRKYYGLTSAGQARLAQASTQWASFHKTVNALLRPTQEGEPRE